jgi:NifU-like protein involved in Fe-S cluster formation
MSDPLYKRELLRLAADAHGAGSLEGPHAHGSAHNPACGDKIEMDVAIAHGRIAALAHQTRACVLTQASASILGKEAKGLDRGGVEALRREVTAMLADSAKAPAAPFDAYAALEGAAPFRNRHTCVLLPIEALLAAFDRT